MPARLGSLLRRNLIAVLALVVALTSGVAWAVEKNSVKSVHIVNGQVKAADLAGANTLFGTAPNINGSTKVLFTFPQMGFRLRADGDTNTSDVGVKVENTRVSGGKFIHVLESPGDAGIVVTPAGGMQPSYQPATPDFFVVDSESPTKRAIHVQCINQAAEGITERVWCWGTQSKP
jgi:hypothetical protein